VNQLDHVQIICTSLQTDNHASSSSLYFNRPDALSDAQPCPSKIEYKGVQHKYLVPLWTPAIAYRSSVCTAHTFVISITLRHNWLKSGRSLTKTWLTCAVKHWRPRLRSCIQQGRHWASAIGRLFLI